MNALAPFHEPIKKSLSGSIEVQYEPGAFEQIFKGCKVMSSEDPMETLKREHMKMKFQEAEDKAEQKVRQIIRDEFDDLLYQHKLTKVEEE